MTELYTHLQFNPNLLIKIDLEPFGIPKSKFYIYLDHLNHKLISGNKLRKLIGSLEEMIKNKQKTLITIGGNYSNYLYACSFLPELSDINVVAVVKGHEPKDYGFTLNSLKEKNIPLHFYPKQEIKDKLGDIVLELKNQNSNSYFVPEGGANEFSHIGFRDLIYDHFDDFNKICVGVGTRATLDGISRYTNPKTELRGYAAMNDTSLIENLSPNSELIFDYTFGGFAKMNNELNSFVEKFKQNTDILLDPIYTSKMVYGIIEDFKKGILNSEEKIVAIHTGGLQGWEGMSDRSIN